jgi:hypothetical protein
VTNVPTAATYFKSISTTNFLSLISILLRGDTYSNTAALFSLMGLPIGSKTYYYGKIVKLVSEAVEKVTLRFLQHNCQQSPNLQEVYLILDAGWSHPGWWARECTVLAVDAKTGLPFAVQHVLRDKNYIGSSKGNIICDFI